MFLKTINLLGIFFTEYYSNNKQKFSEDMTSNLLSILTHQIIAFQNQSDLK